MKLRYKIIALSLGVLLVLCVPPTPRYGAEIYGDAVAWVREDFAASHSVRNAGDGTDADPISWVFPVRDAETYEQIFSRDMAEWGIDFEREMLVVYAFCTETRRDFHLVGIDIEDDTLKITYRKEFLFGLVGDATAPYQRWLVVKMNKVEADVIMFREQVWTVYGTVYR